MSRKVQSLEAIWAPWFEGLAVFGEVAATSPDDPFNAIVTQVLANLIDDEPLDVTAPQRGLTVEEEFARRQREADLAFQAAGRSLGPLRLRSLLEEHPQKYLAGYLAVRGVLSAWRETLGGDLDLPTAFRVRLLHLTRHGTSDAIPDLALPADVFRRDAVDRMCTWLQAAARIEEDSLRAFSQPGDRGRTRWRLDAGRLLEDTETAPEDLPDPVPPMVARALCTFTGPYSASDRVADADELSAAFIDAAAESLGLQTWSLIRQDPDLTNRMIGRTWVLPIGRCFSPFWLTADNHLLLLIRTADGPSREDDARHQLIMAVLSEEDASALRDEMRARRREARMTIVRVADLQQLSKFPQFRGAGTNYLAFVFGEWLHIEHRGMLLGARSEIADSLRSDVAERLLPNSLLDIESVHTSSAAAGAERTLRWLDRSDHWSLDGDPAEAPALLAHIRGVAEAVVRGSWQEDADAAAIRMLTLLVGSEQAAALQSDGLSRLPRRRPRPPRRVRERTRGHGDRARRERVPGSGGGDHRGADRPSVRPHCEGMGCLLDRKERTVTLVTLTQESDFYAALEAAAARPDDALPGLASPLGAAARGLALQAWDAVTVALECVWMRCREALEQALGSATTGCR